MVKSVDADGATEGPCQWEVIGQRGIYSMENGHQ